MTRKDFEEMSATEVFNWLIENEIISEAALKLIVRVDGLTMETLNRVILVFEGCETFLEFIDNEYEYDSED